MAEETPKETTPATRPGSMSDWMERWFGDWPLARFWPDVRRPFPGGDLMPRVEEFTEGNQLVVRAELAGIDPEKDVEIHVADHTLRIRAERRQETKSEEQGRYRSEFQYGSFSRSIPLPAGASDQDVKATYKDGILEVRVPVDQGEAAAKKIPVERG